MKNLFSLCVLIHVFTFLQAQDIKITVAPEDYQLYAQNADTV